MASHVQQGKPLSEKEATLLASIITMLSGSDSLYHQQTVYERYTTEHPAEPIETPASTRDLISILSMDTPFLRGLVRRTTNLPIFHCKHPALLEYMITECGMDMKQKMVDGTTILARYIASLPPYESDHTDALISVIARHGPYDMSEILSGADDMFDNLVTCAPVRALYSLIPYEMPEEQKKAIWKRSPETKRLFSLSYKKSVLNHTDADGKTLLSRFVTISSHDLANKRLRDVPAIRKRVMKLAQDSTPPVHLRLIVPTYVAYFKEMMDKPVVDVGYFRLLCEQGVDLNQRDHGGETFLHHLVDHISMPEDSNAYDHEETVKGSLTMLPIWREIGLTALQFGASPIFTADNDETPMDRVLRLIQESDESDKAWLNDAVPSERQYYEASRILLVEMKNAMKKYVLKPCQYCGKKARLLYCAQCKKVGYCSPECQEADWPRHKKEHRGVAASAADEEEKMEGGRRRSHRRHVTKRKQGRSRRLRRSSH